MSYNWEEICKNKTNKELYEIYIGKTQLPKVVEYIAKNELDKRGFNFNKMVDNENGWKLSSLVEEEIMEQTGMTGRKLSHINLTKYLLINIGFVLSFYVFAKLENRNNFDLNILLIVAFTFSTVITLVNNFIVKQRKLRAKERRLEIENIANNLESKGLVKERNPIVQDFIRDRQKESVIIRNTAIVMIVIGILISTILILNLFLKH